MSKSIITLALFIPFCLNSVACANIETADYDDTIEFVGEDSQAVNVANAANADSVTEEFEPTETNYQFCYRNCCLMNSYGVCDSPQEFQDCHDACTKVPVENDKQERLSE